MPLQSIATPAMGFFLQAMDVAIKLDVSCLAISPSVLMHNNSMSGFPFEMACLTHVLAAPVLLKRQQLVLISGL